MAWPTSNSDLRTLLSDGPTDKLRYRKKFVDQVDGVNTTFKTLEMRRLTNFVTNTDPTFGVFVNGVGVPVVSDVPDVGQTVLVTAPVNGAYVEATYYIQWFLDTELTLFLTQAAQWLGFLTPDQIPPGLQPSATYYGAQEAYHKLALRWAETLSETFRLEDAPSDRTKTPVDNYRMMASDAKKKSVELRDQFYSGKGQEKKPLTASLLGGVGRIVPRS